MIKARFGTDFDRLVQRVFPFVRRIRLRPDTLTLAGVGSSATAALALAFDQWFVAGLLMLLAGFFDVIDGVVARAQGNSSRAGALFDSSMDRVSDLLIFSGIAVSMAAHHDVAGVGLVCWALGASFMTSYVRARAERDLESLGVGLMERGERQVVLVLGALTGYLELAVWVVAIGATVTSIQRLVIARREMRKVAPAETRESETALPETLEEFS